jgi:glycosyltransferase involved in cell wall biosynthesis
MVCSYADDEPISEVLEAAENLAGQVELRFTGNPARRERDWRQGAPSNVAFTGFLPRGEYEQELRDADAVMVLSTAENCLLCGCYEALAAKKPLITSDTSALRTYFFDAEHVAPIAQSIQEGMMRVLGDPKAATERSVYMASKLKQDWTKAFADAKHRLQSLEQAKT